MVQSVSDPKVCPKEHTLGFFYCIKTMRQFILSLGFLLLLLPKSASAETKIARQSASLIRQANPEDTRREEVLEGYLKKFNSPLAPHAAVFVKQADIYSLDWRLLVAISGVESTFAMRYPYNSNNAWGWGIYGDNMIVFNSWEEAITTISKELKVRYIDGWKAQDVYQIGRYYAASPTWAQRVAYFMNDIERFDRKQNHLRLPISI